MDPVTIAFIVTGLALLLSEVKLPGAVAGFFGVAGLFFFHLCHDGSGRMVIQWQTVEMSCQMLLNLTFGFDHKAKADAVAGKAGQTADGKSAGIPKRI